jgi:hypothetical protein
LNQTNFFFIWIWFGFSNEFGIEPWEASCPYEFFCKASFPKSIKAKYLETIVESIFNGQQIVMHQKLGIDCGIKDNRLQCQDDDDDD